MVLIKSEASLWRECGQHGSGNPESCRRFLGQPDHTAQGWVSPASSSVTQAGISTLLLSSALHSFRSPLLNSAWAGNVLFWFEFVVLLAFQTAVEQAGIGEGAGKHD